MTIEDAPVATRERRLGTPERALPVKRSVTVEDDAMGVSGDATSRTFGDEAMLDSVNIMSGMDAEIMSSVIIGVDLTEVYSPARVNEVAAKCGLHAGPSLDLTNGTSRRASIAI